jgi:hypothetical protein
MKMFLIDPIWAAKTYNPNVNTKSVADVTKAATDFIANLLWFYPSMETTHVHAKSTKADGTEYAGGINLIGENGEIRKYFKAQLIASWRDSEDYVIVEMPTILIQRKLYDVRKAMELFNIEPEEDISYLDIADELEYIKA